LETFGKKIFLKTCANQLEQINIYLVGFSKEKQQKTFLFTLEKSITQTIWGNLFYLCLVFPSSSSSVDYEASILKELDVFIDNREEIYASMYVFCKSVFIKLTRPKGLLDPKIRSD